MKKLERVEDGKLIISKLTKYRKYDNDIRTKKRGAGKTRVCQPLIRISGTPADEHFEEAQQQSP